MLVILSWVPFLAPTKHSDPVLSWMCTKSDSSLAYQQNSESVLWLNTIGLCLAKSCLSLCLLVFWKCPKQSILCKTQMLSIQDYRFEYIYFIYTNPDFRLLILV